MKSFECKKCKEQFYCNNLLFGLETMRLNCKCKKIKEVEVCDDKTIQVYKYTDPKEQNQK